jgi:hypothetical protein
MTCVPARRNNSNYFWRKNGDLGHPEKIKLSSLRAKFLKRPVSCQKRLEPARNDGNQQVQMGESWIKRISSHINLWLS